MVQSWEGISTSPSVSHGKRRRKKMPHNIEDLLTPLLEMDYAERLAHLREIRLDRKVNKHVAKKTKKAVKEKESSFMKKWNTLSDDEKKMLLMKWRN